MPPAPTQLPLHALIESPAAVHRAFDIAAHPRVQSLSFGLMDFVSAHGGAIPADGMGVAGPVHASAGGARQARDRLGLPCARQGALALRRDRIQGHRRAARRGARAPPREFGYTRMWSIHPDQIRPILEAFAPDARRDRHRDTKSSLPPPRPRLGADQLSTANWRTGPATATTGRCSRGRTAPEGSCPPKRSGWFDARAS